MRKARPEEGLVRMEKEWDQERLTECSQRWKGFWGSEGL